MDAHRRCECARAVRHKVWRPMSRLKTCISPLLFLFLANKPHTEPVPMLSGAREGKTKSPQGFCHPLAEKTKKVYRREVRRALELVSAESIDALQQCRCILAAINDGEPPYDKVISLGAKCKAMCTLRGVTKFLGESPDSPIPEEHRSRWTTACCKYAAAADETEARAKSETLITDQIRTNQTSAKHCTSLQAGPESTSYCQSGMYVHMPC